MAATKFPAMPVLWLVENIPLKLDGVEQAVGRPVRPADPPCTVGVYADTWTPDPAHCIGQLHPSLARYNINIELFIKSTDEEYGHELHSQISKSLRAMVYGDPDLELSFRGMLDTEFGLTERLMKWGITNQRYMPGDLSGQFVFLSNTALWIETSVH